MENPYTEKIIAAIDGNIGAANAMRLMVHYGMYYVINKLLEYEIRGADIHVFFNDLCDKDPVVATVLINECPTDLLKDACSRQDRSGKKMVKKYLPV